MLKTFSITDIGQKRKINQDYVFSSEKAVGNLPNLFIVADGMGGHKAGEYASKCTVETICEEVKRSFEKNPTIILRKAIEKANENIRMQAQGDANLEGMGTTVVAATLMGKYLHCELYG